MVSNFHLPPMGYGPGSQPPEEDGAELEYLPMPQDMRAYSPHVPDVDNPDKYTPALTLLAEVAAASAQAGKGGENKVFDLSELDADNRGLIAETMGEGEVAAKLHGVPAVAAQESVFAGVWVMHGAGLDALEVGPAPSLAFERAFVPRKPALGDAAEKVPGVVNAPPLLVELLDKSEAYKPDTEVHVINLTLLPHTEQDLVWLDAALGTGSVDVLSRGYGNCRITATATENVWRVQFFNSMDTLILDTFEVTNMPEIALAAPEDLIDSGARILEVLEAIR
ncbi:hydrogenase expression/formation protein [Celeribacter sp.]|uniref:hydrogenase expression/formation protein n=1 Tax=Celeribacter sp. TaxID=1890673 RepID=UPI003A953941